MDIPWRFDFAKKESGIGVKQRCKGMVRNIGGIIQKNSSRDVKVIRKDVERPRERKRRRNPEASRGLYGTAASSLEKKGIINTQESD
jgi:hypothetical protein